MNHKHKKRIERQYFDRAKEQLSAWVDGKVIDDQECPDIVVTTEHCSYGVEVTTITERELKAVIEGKQKICSMAYQKFTKETGRSGLSVKVVFPPGSKITKPQWQPACDQLLKIVTASIPAPSGNAFQMRLENGDDFSSDLFSAIWIHEHPSITRSIWQPAEAFWVPTLTTERIQETIREKDGRVSAYRKRADTLWLLIVVNGFDGATANNIPDEVLNHAYKSEFDGVILFDDAMNKAYQLQKQQ